MTLFPQAIPAELSGTLDGRLLGGRGTVALGEDAIELRLPRPIAATEQEATRIPFPAIDGALVEHRRLTVASPARGTIVIEGDERIAPLGMELERQLYHLPELTRGLRELGSHRASNPDGAGHAAYFAPLLAARREASALAAEGAAPLEVARPLRAERLRRLLAEGRHALAMMHPDGAPRRAIAARLEEACEPLAAALETVQATERTLEESEPLGRARAWRRWSGALAHLFEMADRCWPAVDATLSARLEDTAPVRTSWWRRSRGGSP